MLDTKDDYYLVRHLDEVFTISKEELTKLCEIEKIEPQTKNQDMEEIELEDAIEEAKYEINKCLKINDNCIVKKYKNTKENLEMNGVELGLYEVDRNKNNVASVSLIIKGLMGQLQINMKIGGLKGIQFRSNL
ncbi:unnamed protein product [Meloidogyne enterolobii]|uniref:Uncharacterized protein n=3 Tax=Meloidogyne enterolobii TaxID=390850 RepID=A0ACB1ACS4_MELEN|nr:unnamed protein product [Meloidogyne enterolobii]